MRGWPAVGWGVPVRVGGLQALWQPFLQPVPPSERRQSAPAAVVVAADPAKPGPAASKSITPAGGVGGIAPPSPQRCNRKPNGYIIRIQEGRPQDRPASLGRLTVTSTNTSTSTSTSTNTSKMNLAKLNKPNTYYTTLNECDTCICLLNSTENRDNGR